MFMFSSGLGGEKINFFLLHLFFFFNRFEELVKKFKVEYHAGGSTQNSVKVAQVCSSLKKNY